MDYQFSNTTDNLFDCTQDIFNVPCITLSDTEELSQCNEFSLLPEQDLVDCTSFSDDQDIFGPSFETKSSFNFKTSSTARTRADSYETQSKESIQSKSIKKSKTIKKVKMSKKTTKQYKKMKKTSKILENSYYSGPNSEFTSQFRKEFLNVKPITKISSSKKFQFTRSNNITQRVSTFPLSYHLKYQKPVSDFEKFLEDNDYQLNQEIVSKSIKKTSRRKTKRVTFKSLSSLLTKSKNTNKDASAACFETFKSLKVFSMVCSQLTDTE